MLSVRGGDAVGPTGPEGATAFKKVCGVFGWLIFRKDMINDEEGIFH